MPANTMYVCARCSTTIRSEDGPPKACYKDQGGCQRPSTETTFFGPFPEVAAKNALEIDATYRKYRIEGGLTEPQAIEAIERDGMASPDVIRAVLTQSCLLDQWPVGWREEEGEWDGLAKWMTFADVSYWFSRVVDTTETNALISILLAAQAHLAPVLKAVGSAVHILPVSPKFSAGKSRCAEIITYLGGGEWFDSATVPALKSTRKDGPVLVGIDEGDEAEKDSPGIKGYLLACHAWGAHYLKFSEPGEKGRRTLETIPYGGPVAITFRKKPWEALASRSYIMEMVPSKGHGVSDDGDGEGFRRLLGPARVWLRTHCEEALRDRNEFWALRRTHEPDFLARLDRVAENATVLRQRSFARTVLLTAELLGLDIEEIEAQLTGALAAQELESENAVLIEAIEADPIYREATTPEHEVEVEVLRLRIQKGLRDSREFIDLSRNRFAAVLLEMGYSKDKDRAKVPTWRRVKHDGRQVMVILPGLLNEVRERAQGATPDTPCDPAHMERGSRGSTGSTTCEGAKV